MKFIDLNGIVQTVAAGTRSRALATGVEPNEYDDITAAIPSLHKWPDAFITAGARHRIRGHEAEASGDTSAAAEELFTAAALFHISTCVPHPDRRGHREAADAMKEGLRISEPTAIYLSGDSFVGVLRRPPGLGSAPLVIIVPGLDSSKEEFRYVADALGLEGLATLSIDGPGQGELAEALPLRADYTPVVSEAIDAIDDLRSAEWSPSSIGITALSLGGYFGAAALAQEPRLQAGLIVSGPYSFDWEQLPLPVTDTLELRLGSAAAARQFADSIDLSDIESHIPQPLLIVTGGADIIPGVAPAAILIDRVSSANHLLVEDGDHLLANAHSSWLPQATRWLAFRLQLGDK